MNDEASLNIEADRGRIQRARERGYLATLGVYARLSGPGWLQSAITLGGGSLAGSLYLGVIGGYQLLWLQPLMMILGVVMLSSISYVTLSTGDRPFDTINRHINPVLGWGWAIATLMANLVWAMPQFSLGTAALRQNLAPKLLAKGAEVSVALPGTTGTTLAVDPSDLTCALALFALGTVVVWFYDSGGWGVRLFEILLKLMVGVIVVSFFGVVVAMSMSGGGLPWGEILAGFVPDLQLLFEPADRFRETLAETSAPDFWRQEILYSQRDLMVTAAATAVGINMTFLLPYSMLKRGWGRDFRGLAVFDLATGLFIPFVLATSCVVIAAASQFHGQYDQGLVGDAEPTALTKMQESAYRANLTRLASHLAAPDGQEGDAARTDAPRQNLNSADHKLAAMLVRRDAYLLANSLERLTGPFFAQKVFGIGVLGMAISTIIILMLINGFTMCEMLGLRSQGYFYRFCCLLPGVSGVLGFLFLWSNQEANFWLAVPTSVFGMVLLPVAYVTFFLLNNSRAVLGDQMPRGLARLLINLLMLVALGAATVGAGWSIWGRTQKLPALEVRWVGIALVLLLATLAIVVQIAHYNQRRVKNAQLQN